MTCATCTECALCEHTEGEHPRKGSPGCLGTTPAVTDTVSGPPRPFKIPCLCPGFKPRRDDMSTPTEPSVPATGIAADVADVAEVAEDTTTALADLTSALNLARQVYDSAINAAHLGYLTAMNKFHHGQLAAPAEQGPAE